MKFLLDKDGVAFSSEFIESIYAVFTWEPDFLTTNPAEF